MLLDYHIHAVAHGEYQYSKEWINQFIDTALKRGIKEIGLSEHDEYSSYINVNIIKEIQKERAEDINIRLGLELDYIPGNEDKIKHIIRENEYDYLIGSIHYIDGWAFDHPDYKDEFEIRDIDEVYSRYSQLLIQMINSGLFDIVGHMDLVKKWGHRPSQNRGLLYMESVLDAISKSSMVVELNSAGWRKPVNELYPEPALLELMFNKNIPITLGSDAHHPDEVGEGLKEALLLARKAGYKYITAFNKRQQFYIPLV